MSGVALKITTLVIRTVSKPIANRIKAQAKEHDGFRRICVGWAQLIHRVDMRLRLGLLQDPAVLERQAVREAAEAAKKKRLAEAPTVKTEAQTRADEDAARQAAKDGVKELKKKDEKKKIKPLSEAKAIDLGANFIAESFLFCVAVGTVLFETYRSRKKERNRRDDVAEQLAELRDRDDVKSVRIEELEREVKELKSHEWHWPWQKPEPRDEAEALRHSKVLAEVAVREREREAARKAEAEASGKAIPKEHTIPKKAESKAQKTEFNAPQTPSSPAEDATITARPDRLEDAGHPTPRPVKAGLSPQAPKPSIREQK